MRRFLPLIAAASTLTASMAFGATSHTRHASTASPAHKTAPKASLHHASLTRKAHGRGAHEKSARETNPHGHLAAISMDPDRATQIQQALIKSGYLTGEPTGKWDQASVAAMQKLQSDNGWQTKIMPDSRALIKLGLGPGAETISAAGGGPASTTLANAQ